MNPILKGNFMTKIKKNEKEPNLTRVLVGLQHFCCAGVPNTREELRLSDFGKKAGFNVIGYNRENFEHDSLYDVVVSHGHTTRLHEGVSWNEEIGGFNLDEVGLCRPGCAGIWVDGQPRFHFWRVTEDSSQQS
jgi:hypothetical protein